MAARGAIRAWTLTTMDLDLTGLSFRPQILDSGVAEHELRRTLRYGQLKRLRPGAYVRADHRDLNDRVARHALLVSAAVPALSPAPSSATPRQPCCMVCQSGTFNWNGCTPADSVGRAAVAAGCYTCTLPHGNPTRLCCLTAKL